MTFSFHIVVFGMETMDDFEQIDLWGVLVPHVFAIERCCYVKTTILFRLYFHGNISFIHIKKSIQFNHVVLCNFQYFKLSLGDIVASFLLSFLFYITIEGPSNQIIRAVMMPPNR